jgi:hypothetical protein
MERQFFGLEKYNIGLEKLDFHQVLWRQLDRIGGSIQDKDSWCAGILTLQLFLTPYFREETEKDLKDVESENLEKTQKYTKILKILMILMDRKGWLMTKKRVGGEPDND